MLKIRPYPLDLRSSLSKKIYHAKSEKNLKIIINKFEILIYNDLKLGILYKKSFLVYAIKTLFY